MGVEAKWDLDLGKKMAKREEEKDHLGRTLRQFDRMNRNKDPTMFHFGNKIREFVCKLELRRL